MDLPVAPRNCHGKMFIVQVLHGRDLFGVHEILGAFGDAQVAESMEKSQEGNMN